MTNQTNADLIAEARERAECRDTGSNVAQCLLELAAALEAAEQERDEARKAAEDHVLDADAVHVRLSAELREVNQERDNWKMSAEEAERAEKRWKDRAVEAERERDRLDEAFDRDLPWRYDEVEAQRNQLAAALESADQEIQRQREINRRAERQTQAEEQRAEAWKRLCESTETALTEVIDERNQLAAVVEKVRAEVEGESGWFRHRAGRVLDILAAPADALRELKAEAWQEGAYRVYNSTLDEAEWWWSDWANENPYKEEKP